MNAAECIKQIKSIGRGQRTIECCGFIGESGGDFILKQVENKAPDPENYFVISPLEYLNFKLNFNIVAIFHTHAHMDEKPSEFDVKMSNGSGAPFLIYSPQTDKFALFEPFWEGEYNEGVLNKFEEESGETFNKQIKNSRVKGEA